MTLSSFRVANNFLLACRLAVIVICTALRGTVLGAAWRGEFDVTSSNWGAASIGTRQNEGEKAAVHSGASRMA
jgi:hypothetical protein